MKTVGLMLVLTVVLSSGVFAAEANIDIYPGWQTIATPIVPFDPTPNKVFGSPVDWDMNFPQLMRWDSTASPQGYVTYSYNYDDGVDANFGSILLGEGYLFYSDVASTAPLTVTGVANGVPGLDGKKTDMWISLPKAGWTLIGNPYAEDVPVDQDGSGAPIAFTNGVEVRDFADASEWVEPLLWKYDAASGRYVSLSYGYFGDDFDMKIGAGYFIKTKVDNLAMIITAPATN